MLRNRTSGLIKNTCESGLLDTVRTTRCIPLFAREARGGRRVAMGGNWEWVKKCLWKWIPGNQFFHGSFYPDHYKPNMLFRFSEVRTL